MKRIILIICVLTFFVALPIYAAGRLIVPDWLKNELISKVPEGVYLSVGKIASSPNLNIFYQDIVYTSQNVSVRIPKLIVSPKLNFHTPLILSAEDIIISQSDHIIALNDVIIKIQPKGMQLEDIQFEGSAASVDNERALKIEATKFLISSITEKSLKMEIFGKKAHVSYENQTNKVSLILDDFKSNLTLDQDLELDLRSSSGKVMFGNSDPSIKERTFFTQEISGNFKLNKDKVWSMPLSVLIKGMTTEQGMKFDSFDINAVGEWNEDSKGCELRQLFNSSDSCGKLINVLEVIANVYQAPAYITFRGNGYCVAPRSGCRQKIRSKLTSKNTSLIFSNVISAGLINPLVGGILLGGMLSSPKDDSDHTFHELRLDVDGSQIFINEEPLIK